jgi:hypothetical protein
MQGKPRGLEMGGEERVFSGDDIELAENVRQRWNEDNPDFGGRLEQYRFTLFYCGKPPRKSPNGTIFLCTDMQNLHWECGYNDERGWADLDNVYLLKSEVGGHEKQFNYLLFPVVERKKINENSGSQQEIYLTSEDVCKRWSLSPAQLVDLIRGNNDLVVYYRRQDECPF